MKFKYNIISVMLISAIIISSMSSKEPTQSDLDYEKENGNGTTENEWKLSWAVKYGDEADVEKLLDKDKTNPNPELQRSTIPPLAKAAGLGKLKLVKLLLRHGANPNTINKSNKSALASAIIGIDFDQPLSDDDLKERMEIIKILLEAGSKSPGFKEVLETKFIYSGDEENVKEFAKKTGFTQIENLLDEYEAKAK